MILDQNIKAIIIGAGGHAQVVYSAIASGALPNAHVVGFVTKPEGLQVPDSPKLFNLPVWEESPAQLESLKSEQGVNAFVFGLGSVKSIPQRWEVYQYYLQQGLQPLSVIHPEAFVDKTATIEPGCYIGAKAVVQPLARVGEASIINTAAIVEHHTTVGKNAHVAPGAILCGQVQLGDHSFVGAGSCVIQSKLIANNVTVGAGCVVRQNLLEGQVFTGTWGQFSQSIAPN